MKDSPSKANPRCSWIAATASTSTSCASSNDAFDSGETELYLSATDGSELALSHPAMAFGNAFSSWTGALHRARVGGIPYKIVVALTGLAAATLSITGFIVWLKRRRRAQP